MTPSLPRVCLMCLALAFASVWLGCGPDLDDEEELDGPSTDSAPLDVDEGEVCGN